MARMRTIKPEFCTSGQLAECSRDARLLFALMWMFCDDYGRYKASAKRLKMECFPADNLSDEQILEWIGELRRAVDEHGEPLLLEYEVDHCKYWEVTGFLRNQRVDKPYYRHPGQDGKIPSSTQIPRKVQERSDNVPRMVHNHSAPELEPEPDTGVGTGTGIVTGIRNPGAGSRRAGAFTKLDEPALRDASRLREWFDWATSQRRPVITNTEANWLRVLGAAERACEVGDNPVALFASIVAGGKWDLISNEQEDRGRQKDKERQRGPAARQRGGGVHRVGDAMRVPT